MSRVPVITNAKYSCNKRNHNIESKIKTFYLLEEARTHWALVHGRGPFSLVFEFFLRIFSIAKTAISAIHAKTSITTRNASTEVLQFFFRIRLPLGIIWTSALFTVVPCKCVSSCFVKRYPESVIVLSNCRCKFCYDPQSVLELYCLRVVATRRLEVIRSVWRYKKERHRKPMSYFAAENVLISPFQIF